MILKLSRNNAVLKKSHDPIENVSFKEMSMVLCQKVRIGTTLQIVSDNSKVKPHRGKYYLLFMEEYDMVYIFYLDVSNNLRVIYTGPMLNAVSAVYSMIADNMEIKVLQSKGKRAYRVAMCNPFNESVEIKSAQYKNKSSERINQVYMNLFEAINFAVKISHDTHKQCAVITPKGSKFFIVG